MKVNKYRPTKLESFLAIFWTTLSLWLMSAAGIVMYVGWLPKSIFGLLFLGIGLLVYCYWIAKGELKDMFDSKK